MAIHSSTIAWKIPWTEEPGRLQSHGIAKSWTRLSDFSHSLTLQSLMVQGPFILQSFGCVELYVKTAEPCTMS